MLKLFRNLLTTDNEDESISQDSDIQSIVPNSLESQIIQADRLRQQGRLGEALILYRQAIKQYPQSAKTYEYLSVLLKQQGDIAEAYEKLAAELKEQGQTEQAATYYRQAIGLKTLTGDTKAELINSNLNSNLVERKINSSKIVKLDDTAFSFQPLANSALVPIKSQPNLGATEVENSRYYALFNNRYAKINSQQVQNVHWETAQVYLQQALEFSDRQEWEQAAAACEQATKIFPDLAEAYKIWGNALQRMGNTAEAMELYSQAIELKPDLSEVYAGIGDLYCQQQKWHQAIKYYQKSSIINPNASIYRILADIWQKLGETEKAQLNIYKAIELESELAATQDNEIPTEEFTPVELNEESLEHSVKLYRQTAYKLEQKQKWQQAAICYRKALELSQSQLALLPSAESDNSQSENGVTVDAISETVTDSTPEETQLDKAIRRYRQQVSLQPNSAKTHTDLGNLYSKKKQWDLAIAFYQKAIAIDSQYTQAYLNLARAYFQTDNLTEFVQQMDLALALKPNIASAEDRLNLGNALAQQGNLERAVNCFYKAILLQPNFAQAYHRLVEVLGEQGKHEDAIEFCQKAVIYNPQDSDAYYLLGEQLVAVKRWVLAVKAFSKVLDLQPRFPQASQKLNHALAEKLKLDLQNRRG